MAALRSTRPVPKQMAPQRGMNHARPEETCSPVASRRFIKLAYVAWKLNGNAGSINMVIEILAQILAAGAPAS